MMSCNEIHDIFRLKNSGLMATRSPVTTQMWSRTTTQLDTIATAVKQTTLWIAMQISTMPQPMPMPIIMKRHSLGGSQTMFSVWGWRKNTLLVWDQPAAAFVICDCANVHCCHSVIISEKYTFNFIKHHGAIYYFWHKLDSFETILIEYLEPPLNWKPLALTRLTMDTFN